jgi:serine protease Do
MTFSETRSRETASWAGAKVRNIVGMGEVSAKGTPGETGVILVEVPDGSDAEKAGLFEGDVMLAVDGKRIEELHDLFKCTREAGPRKPLSITVLRYGQESTVEIKLAP